MSPPNPLQQTALDHLRVIRTLMERAHIYRAVSAPAALVGGVLSLAVAIFGYWQNDYFLNHSEGIRTRFGSREFLFAWICVLVATATANLILLTREARAKGLALVTEGLRAALRSIVPPMLTGAILGACLLWFGSGGQIVVAALVWILCYGLALQGTVSFAPRSIIWLARAFLLTGQALTVFYFWKGELGMYQNSEAPASLFLGLTFGLYHIIYAIAVFLSKPNSAAAAG